LNPWLPPCEICTGHSCTELRCVEDRERRVRNARSVAVDGRIGGHDPPRFAGRLPGRYGYRLLPICCLDVADPTFETTIRITHLQHASCLSWKLDDLRFI
jgi:hypothetical protein